MCGQVSPLFLSGILQVQFQMQFDRFYHDHMLDLRNTEVQKLTAKRILPDLNMYLKTFGG